MLTAVTPVKTAVADCNTIYIRLDRGFSIKSHSTYKSAKPTCTPTKPVALLRSTTKLKLTIKSTMFDCTCANQYLGRTASTRHLLSSTNAKAGSGDSTAIITLSTATASNIFKPIYAASLNIDRRFELFRKSI